MHMCRDNWAGAGSMRNDGGPQFKVSDPYKTTNLFLKYRVLHPEIPDPQRLYCACRRSAYTAASAT